MVRPPLERISYLLVGRVNTHFCVWHSEDAPQKGGKWYGKLFKCAECIAKAKEKREHDTEKTHDSEAQVPSEVPEEGRASPAGGLDSLQ